jgi:curved DNA-binding protein CbpA
LKYHPDRNVDDQYAAAKYKAVTDAYHVLIDPIKRKQYDQQGEEPSQTASTSEATEQESSLSGIGRVFGAVISRFGLPLSSHVAPDVIQTAQSICRNGGIEGGGPPLDVRVNDLPWGWSAQSKVDRQNAAFYRLTVDPQHAETGFIIHCRSVSKGKFKIILFDKNGIVMYEEESIKHPHYTHSTLFFTTFDTYLLGEPSSSSTSSNTSEKIILPPLFSKLEGFVLSKKKILPGQYLLCVYGDNFLGKTAYSIIAVPAKNDSIAVQGLEEADEQLTETKVQLEMLKNEYFQVS